MKSLKLNMVMFIGSFALTNLMAEIGVLDATTLSFSSDGATEIAALKNAENKAKSFNRNKYYLHHKSVTYDINGGNVNVMLLYFKKPDRN